MAHELIYTSAPRGLLPGSHGFTTVAMTAGLPRGLATRLEGLSAYRPLYPAGDARAGENPVSYAHWRVSASQQAYNVLSRVAFAGIDYTQRPGKLAHHIALEASELVEAGPAWVMRQPGVMQAEFTGEPRYLPVARAIPAGDRPPRICSAWAAATGDAGWAGALVQAFLTFPSRPAYLLLNPGHDALALIEEAIALLPPSERWLVTFNTYLTDLPAGLDCAWRCVLTGTIDAQKPADSLVMDLTRPMGKAPSSPYATSARTGQSLPEERSLIVIDESTPNPAPTPALTPEATPSLASPPVVVQRSNWPTFWAIAVIWPIVVALAIWLIVIRSSHRSELNAKNAQMAVMKFLVAHPNFGQPATTQAAEDTPRAIAEFPGAESPTIAPLEFKDRAEAELVAKTPGKLTLLLAADVQGVTLKSTDTGCILTLDGKNNVGGDTSRELLEISRKDGQIIWDWKEEKGEEAMIILLYSAIRIGVGDHALRVQFTPIVSCRIHTGPIEPQLMQAAGELRGLAELSPTLRQRSATEYEVVLPRSDVILYRIKVQ